MDPDEIEGLIPEHISTLAQLNEWEQKNILTAENYYAQRKYSHTDILDYYFIKQIHEKMFDKTWRWAGTYRLSEKSIGVDPNNIQIMLKQLLDDIKFQIQNKTFSLDEIVARFHHRLVFIHLFSNGNGRHARFVSDLLLISMEQPSFSWGIYLKDNMTQQEIRKEYIEALRSADKGHYQSLLKFVRQ